MQGYLDCCNPNVDNASGDASKEDKAKEALQGQKTPHKTQQDAEDL